MPDRLVFGNADQRGRIPVERRDGDAQVALPVISAFDRDSAYRRAARSLEVDVALLQRCVDEHRRKGTTEFALSEDEVFSVVVRSRTASDGKRYGSIEEALSGDPGPDSVVTWSGTDALAALDVDFHSSSPPPDLMALANLCEPRPFAMWTTHGGGLRLLYKALDGYRAGELAAAAAVHLNSRVCAAFEVKADTRHPLSEVDGHRAGIPVYCSPTSDFALPLGGECASASDVEAWLESRGLNVGERYEHDRCPVHPGPGSEGTRPVAVHGDHVFCFRCEGHGVCHGTSRAGFFPYTALIGGGTASAFRQCVERFCHWEHASHFVRAAFGLSDSVSRSLYSAALRRRHGADDRRVDYAFKRGRNLIRLERRWTTCAGESYRITANAMRPVFSGLPACMSPDGEPNPERVAVMEQPIDLSTYGYPALQPVWGCRIFGQHMETRDVTVLFSPPCLQGAGSRFRPRYVDGANGGTLEGAWADLERVFPGLDRRLIRLLIAARGVAEGGISMPPMLFISGPTGSAKTTSVIVAAAVCGDSNHSVPWSPNIERVRAALMEAKESGTYVTFNELLKDGKNAGKNTLQCMDFLLNITPDALSHKLYVGPVKLGSLPVCVWTDTAVPLDLKRQGQLARRLTHVHLPARVDWKTSLRDTGVGQPWNLRVAGYAAACDVVLSSVVDEFFREPHTFEEIAAQLGFAQLECSAEAEEGLDEVRALFDAVCEAHPAVGADAKRWTGRGWKVAVLGAEDPLSEAWTRVADDAQSAESRRVSEVDLKALLGLRLPAVLETRQHGSRVAIRFVHRITRQNVVVNGDLR